MKQSVVPEDLRVNISFKIIPMTLDQFSVLYEDELLMLNPIFDSISNRVKLEPVPVLLYMIFDKKILLLLQKKIHVFHAILMQRFKI